MSWPRVSGILAGGGFRRLFSTASRGQTGYTVGMAAAAEKARWYRVTPGRLLPLLLAVEGFLWLSERFHWFAFNQRSPRQPAS